MLQILCNLSIFESVRFLKSVCMSINGVKISCLNLQVAKVQSLLSLHAYYALITRRCVGRRPVLLLCLANFWLHLTIYSLSEMSCNGISEPCLSHFSSINSKR
jgi:hypothetical protein